MFAARVLKVLISTPGDTAAEVAAVTQALHDWNADRAEAACIILMPIFWKTHAVPMAGGSGQSVIDEQLVDDADIVVAIFDARLGQETADAVSGTAHEIERSINAGKPVHVWFSTEPLPHNIDIQELQRLRAFKADMATNQLYGEYDSTDSLGLKVRQAIENDITKLGSDKADVLASLRTPHQVNQALGKDIELVDYLLTGWEPGGPMHVTLSQGVDFKHYPASFYDALMRLDRRLRDDPRAINSQELQLPYEELKLATADHAEAVQAYLWTDDDNREWLRTSREKESEMHTLYLEELKKLTTTAERFRQALNKFHTAVHAAR
ncbi:hypothetical protein [Mycobacteroides abscessus]|uniref:hypothetical protein n=1 Tax=Mycobacteroides abscessus TaxID=36809 RepID=UPI000C259E8A|nr:hypothetical protein [Mycobacteroides abscessus]